MILLGTYLFILSSFILLRASYRRKKKFSQIEYKAYKKWQQLDFSRKQSSLYKLFRVQAHSLTEKLIDESFKRKLSSCLLKNKKEKDADISALRKYLFNRLEN